MQTSFFQNSLVYVGSLYLFSISLKEINKSITDFGKHNNSFLSLTFNSSVFYLSSYFLINSTKRILSIADQIST